MCFTEYVADRLVAVYDWGELDLADPDAVAQNVGKVIAEVPPEFWTVPWRKGSYDTKSGRDLVVRSIAPSGSAGKVFGFTYSGMDVGSAISTLLFGYMLSQNQPFWVFMLIGTFLMLGVFSILFAKMAAQKSTAPVTA